MVRPQDAIELQGIVHHHDAAPGPGDFEGWVLKAKAQPCSGRIEGVAFLVVVAEHSVERHVERTEHVKRLGLGDVAGVYHRVHGGLVETVRRCAGSS